jgi:hypothetical protein
MTPTTLPPSALRVLLVILDAAREERLLTVREIMVACGWTSPNAVMRHVVALRAAGLIQHEFGQARTIRATCRLEVEATP